MSEEYFRAFVQARWPGLVRYAYLLTGDAGHAEDVVQVALERTWRRWDRVSIERPEAYVRTAIAREVVSWHRRLGRRVRERPLGEGYREPVDLAGEVGAGDGLRELLWSELAALPPRMRAVVVLRVWEDLSEQEVARALECSVGTVKSQLSRALLRLRERALVLELREDAVRSTADGDPRRAR